MSKMCGIMIDTYIVYMHVGLYNRAFMIITMSSLWDEIKLKTLFLKWISSKALPVISTEENAFTSFVATYLTPLICSCRRFKRNLFIHDNFVHFVFFGFDGSGRRAQLSLLSKTIWVREFLGHPS